MLYSNKLFTVAGYDFKINHLLIIGILVASFSISFLLRAIPDGYGFELNEFDPFFNYRATEYIVNNGIGDYLNWHDDLSWYPHGRDVSLTSQVMLHITTASTYWIFGSGSSLYDYTILFPAVIGSLTTIVVFALVRTISGTTAGLFASLFFAVSIPVLLRGTFGWFKSEPLGLFFSLLAIYLLLSGIHSNNKKIIIPKLITAGILTTFGLSAWGGNQFFIIPIGIFFLTLPFCRKDHNFIIWAIPLFTLSVIISSFGFERVSTSFLFGLGGISLIVPTIFLVACILIQKKSTNHKIRNGLLFLFGILIIASSLLILDVNNDILPISSHRYLNAINPFLTTTDPLVDSISEHATTTIEQSFYFHSVLLIFSGIGVWLILNRQSKSQYFKTDMIFFALIIGMAGVYTSSTFVRLEIFASISLIILSSMGLQIMIKEFVRKDSKNSIPIFIKIPSLIGIVILLMIPMIYPEGQQIHATIQGPPTILNGGTNYVQTVSYDWLETLDWIKNNTPKDAIVASWWDYGYWISTMGERTTLVDNATLDTLTIQEMARMLMGTPDDGWKKLQDMNADYVVTFVAAQQVGINVPGQFYVVAGGGDESKKQWFLRIGGFDETQYLHSDGISGKDQFWNNTILGQMFPFTLLGYIDPNNIQQQSKTFVPGMIGIYQKNIKFPEDGNGPLKLVHASPSFYQDQTGPKLIVLVYEVNKNYVPLN